MSQPFSTRVQLRWKKHWTRIWTPTVELESSGLVTSLVCHEVDLAQWHIAPAFKAPTVLSKFQHTAEQRTK